MKPLARHSAAVCAAALALVPLGTSPAHAAQNVCSAISPEQSLLVEPDQASWYAFNVKGPFTSALYNEDLNKGSAEAISTVASQNSSTMFVGAYDFTTNAFITQGWFIATYLC